MNYYPNTLMILIRRISTLPGIGEKTAERLALHILRSPEKDVRLLAQSILDVKEKVGYCEKCFSLSDGPVCSICMDDSRDKGLICVVEQPADMVAIEKSGAYKGRYHVLKGVLSPINGVGPKDLRIGELLKKIKEDEVDEVILATSTGVEGEATADYLAELLDGYSVRVTRIASGVPVGGDLKYIDSMTLKRALNHRRDL